MVFKNFKLRPEINKPIYWLHIVLIAIIVNFMFGFGLDFFIILRTSITIAIADIIVHTLLKLD